MRISLGNVLMSDIWASVVCRIVLIPVFMMDNTLCEHIMCVLDSIWLYVILSTCWLSIFSFDTFPFFFFTLPLPRFVPSQDDVAVFEALGKAPAGKYSHALRWYNHISSFGAEKSKFPGVKKALSNQAPAPAAADDDDDDDEVDLFGSDEEEEVSRSHHRLRLWNLYEVLNVTSFQILETFSCAVSSDIVLFVNNFLGYI